VSTTGAAILAIACLAGLGALPSLAAVGWRVLALPLAVVAGAVVAALAAGSFLLLGGTFLLWTVVIGLLAAVLVAVRWWRIPSSRPTRPSSGEPVERAVLGLGGLGALVALAWSLRGLATPTVGFDTRALWALRAGWLLHSHAQALLDFKVRMFAIGQSGYPPLVSAVGALAWGTSGLTTDRLAVVVVALVDAACLGSISLGLLAMGRQVARRTTGTPRLGVLLMAAVAAISIVPIAAGITEPFLTNGYADPTWALAGAGAIVFGCQLADEVEWRGAAAILVLAMGMSKQEGLLTAACLIVLMTMRRIGRHRDIAAIGRIVGASALELVGLAWWWMAIHGTGARDVTSPLAPTATMGHRATAVARGFAPSLHVLVLAGLVTILGALFLRRVRRRVGLANDAWAWLGLGAGIAVVSLVLITGQAPVEPWIAGSVHRVTQYPAIVGWLLVAAWGITAVAGTADDAARAVAPA
jgi:hypothetical protein